jgi:DNA-binding CsgD family transcriptional regulator/PAS domain-containing protein
VWVQLRKIAVNEGFKVMGNSILEVVGHIYDSATDMQKWPVFLESLADAFDAPYTNILHFDPKEARFNFWLTHGPELPKDMLEIFQASFASDPRAIECGKFPGKPLSCRLSIGEDVWHQSALYQGMLENQERFPIVEYSLSLLLPGEDGAMTGLAVLRWKDGKAFSQAECDLMGEIIPHLRRAIELQKRFVESDFVSRTAHEVLDHMPTGIVVVDEDGKLRHCNRAVKEMALRSDGISIAGDTIRLEKSAQNSDLHVAVRAAISSAKTGHILPGHTLRADRAEEKENYSILVSTLWGNHLNLGLGILDEPLAVIFITDPDRPQEAPAELLQRLYGFTPSEARLVEGLIAFDSLDEAANSINISILTARQYLKSIFQKTDTQRQSMLIKKILSSPIWMQNQLNN